MRWIAIVLVFALVIVAMASGGSLMQIVNFPSVVFTFLLGHATLYAVYGKDSFSILSPGFVIGAGAPPANINSFNF